MLKKPRLLTRPTTARLNAPFRWQNRSEWRDEEVHSALRVDRSPLEWILANGKAPYSDFDLREFHLVLWGSERCENAVGRLFQHSARLQPDI